MENMENKEEKDIEIIEELDENLMDHKYDGIMELDNVLPPWWLYLFYGTVIFGAVYAGRQYFTDSFNQMDEYAAELEQAEADIAAYKAEFGGPDVDESTVTIASDEKALADGKEIYTTNCVACHLVNGGGSVGPNLTDEYWLHGGGIKEVFKTIKYGVPEKGMIPWETQLNPTQMQNVASYILTELAGKNVEGGKEPQGDKWTGEATTEEAPADTSATADTEAEADTTATEEVAG